MDSERISQLSWRFFPCFDDNKEQKLPTEITSCAFNSTGKLLAFAFGDHRVLVFNDEKTESASSIQEWSRVIYTVSNKGMILSVDWKDDGTSLAAGDFNNLFYLFSTSDSRLLSFSQVSSKLTKIQWNHKGSMHLLLTSCDDGTVVVWNSPERTPWVVQKYALHTSSVCDIQWLTMETFASCSMDGSIHVCHIKQEKPIHSLFNESPTLSIRFNMKYNYLAFYSYDQNVKLWLLDEEDNIRELQGHNGGVYSISWNENDDFSSLASGGDDKTVRIWNINNIYSDRVLRDHCSLISAVSFSPNGLYLAAADSDGVVIVWSTETWDILMKRQCPATILDASSLRWNAQSTRLVVVNQSPQICVFQWNSITDHCTAL